MRRAHSAVIAAALLVACGRVDPKGELMVAVTSQMPVPKDIGTVSIEIRTAHTRRAYRSFKTNTGASEGVPLPATLAVIEGKNAAEPVVIRVGAWDRNDVLRVVRTVTTTVPTSRIALLPVELEWLCYDKVKPVREGDVANNDGDDGDPNDPYVLRSSCNAGDTCVAGRCVPDVVDSATLPDFVKDELSKTSDGNGCLDVPGCFANASQVFFADRAACQIDRLQGGVGINIALDLPPGNVGFCTAERCLIPLSGFSPSGWTESGTRLQLAPAVCELLTGGSVRSVVVTTGCPTKTATVAACQVAVGSPSGTDAGL